MKNKLVKIVIAALTTIVLINTNTFEYSNAIVHAFQKFKAPFSGKIVHIETMKKSL